MHRILQANKWPNKMQIIQRLSENVKWVSKSFVEMEILCIRTNENQLSVLTFSDEAYFHLDGRVNRHNFRCWSQKKSQAGSVRKVFNHRAPLSGLSLGNVEFTVHSSSTKILPVNHIFKCLRNHFGP